ncbi:hypothetical protein [Thermus caldilimi]|uniref:hypothetical protein n=1 Tax=Thermus caldilimi TaxID=2483360 RepID=UPI001F0E4A35|nr:hypothetical protein [Thermus caldilimi]
MKELQRYERALQIALDRLGAIAYAGQTQLQDVYRLVNTIEDLERQAGIQHVRVRSTAKGKEEEALARLEALGYEVHIYPDIGPRDGEVGWIAVAFYEGHVVAYGFGDTQEDALRDLVGEVGA